MFVCENKAAARYAPHRQPALVLPALDRPLVASKECRYLFPAVQPVPFGIVPVAYGSPRTTTAPVQRDIPKPQVVNG